MDAGRAAGSISDWSTLIQGGMTVVLALCLWIINSLAGRIKQLENWKVDKGQLKTELQVVEERFRGIDQRIIDAREFNATDHRRIEIRVTAVQEDIEEIKKCLVKIAQKKEC